MNKDVGYNVDLIKEGLEALAKFQFELDQATWQVNETDMDKVRHISLHLSIVNGSLSRLCEKWEHDIRNSHNAGNNFQNVNEEVLQDIIADLLMHASQLSNIIKINPYCALAQRVSENIKRYAPESEIKLPL